MKVFCKVYSRFNVKVFVEDLALRESTLLLGGYDIVENRLQSV